MSRFTRKNAKGISISRVFMGASREVLCSDGLNINTRFTQSKQNVYFLFMIVWKVQKKRRCDPFRFGSEGCFFGGVGSLGQAVQKPDCHISTNYDRDYAANRDTASCGCGCDSCRQYR